MAHDAPTRVAILIVCYNGKAHLADCLGSIVTHRPRAAMRVVVVDNASTDGSADFIHRNYPWVELVRLGQNLGFAGGNNAGWDHVRRCGEPARYLCLLNQDTIVTAGWLDALVDHLETHPGDAAAQPKILLHPETSLINTAGNRCHFLGFGFMTGYRQPDRGQFDAVAPIDFPSGAAVLLRAAALQHVGLFDPQFFMYLEDVELAWKLRQIGARIVRVPASVIHHKYAFNSDYRYYYFLERNRWWLLLTYLKWPTLVLLLPAIIAMELGQLVFALSKGVLGDKLRSGVFFLSPANLRALREARRQAQARRTVSDRAFMRDFSGVIEFEALRGVLVRFVANPLLGAYWAMARRVMWW